MKRQKEPPTLAKPALQQYLYYLWHSLLILVVTAEAELLAAPMGGSLLLLVVEAAALAEAEAAAAAAAENAVEAVAEADGTGLLLAREENLNRSLSLLCPTAARHAVALQSLAQVVPWSVIDLQQQSCHFLLPT
jgi:hypothetical protein